MSINLNKNASINLSKEVPSGLSKIVLGVGWDTAQAQPPAKTGGFLGGLFGGSAPAAAPVSSIDLDASAILFSADGVAVDTVFFRQLKSRDGSVVHTGDNLTGEGDGDDEKIKVNLSSLPASVAHIVFTVSSFRGQTFSQIANAFCRVVDETTGKELVRTNLSDQGGHTAVILARLSREQSGEFHFKSLLVKTNGKTAQELASEAGGCLS